MVNLRAVNRRRELRYDVRQTTDVVKVTVGDDVGPQFVLDLLQIGRIGDAVVDTRQVDAKVVAAVHDDGVVHVFDEDHVLGAAAVHAAEADDLEARAVVDDVGAALVCLCRLPAGTGWRCAGHPVGCGVGHARPGHAKSSDCSSLAWLLT